MDIIAKSQGVRISTRKVRLVADAIRNKKVLEALDILSLAQKRGAYSLLKTVKSALANAKVANLSENDLFIAELAIDEGAFLKRYRPSTRGRIHPYKKRSTHIKVVLREIEKPKKELSEAKSASGGKGEVK